MHLGNCNQRYKPSSNLSKASPTLQIYNLAKMQTSSYDNLADSHLSSTVTTIIEQAICQIRSIILLCICVPGCETAAPPTKWETK